MLLPTQTVRQGVIYFSESMCQLLCSHKVCVMPKSADSVEQVN